jgi:hypothetical protein
MFDQKEYMKKYHINHREKRLARNKQWRKDNPDSWKIWAKNNPKKIRIIHNRWQNKEYKINLKFKLDKKIKEVIKNSLKNNCKGKYWEKLLGYNANELKKHLQKTIPKGYSWQDYLQGKLHIDHIIPKSTFNYASIENPDFRKCWEFKNLRLLPAKENLKKSKKLTRPFQPALKL